MGQYFSGGLLGGVTAATIWMAISLWVGMDTSTVGLWALIILIGTTIIATVIGSAVGRAAGPRAGSASAG